MIRRKLFFALLTVMIPLIATDTIAVFTADNIRPADEYSDPADYELIIIDKDGWELRMNMVTEKYSVRRYKGILFYRYGSRVGLGNLSAVYYKAKGVLLVSCIDTGWHNATLSYSLQDFGGDTDLDRTWDVSGLYLYLETGIGNTIGADIVKGSLD